jgi:hypothetical protein
MPMNNCWPFFAIDLTANVPNRPMGVFKSVVSRFRTAQPPRTTKSSEDGGFDENDVMVAVSLPVAVLASRQAPRSEDEWDSVSTPCRHRRASPVASAAGCVEANCFQVE